ncbi:MAG: pyrroline-5-carboxylate reductase [Pseudomonadota bacterium]
MQLPFTTILVVGAGKMGGALVDGWLAEGVPAASVHLVDPTFAEGDRGWTAKGVCVHAGLESLGALSPDLLMLAIKPQMMEAVLPSFAPFDGPDMTVLSVAAGTTRDHISNVFSKACVIRSMPNTAAAVGQGATAVFGQDVPGAVRDGITALLEAVGKVVWLDDEAQMDAVTALSGSGPAYVFHMVEAMAEAGEQLGLSPETSMALARQTVVGAGALLGDSPETAAQLRTNVTSPGGTTAAGLSVLRDGGRLTELMADTMKAARDRSKALASKP